MNVRFYKSAEFNATTENLSVDAIVEPLSSARAASPKFVGFGQTLELGAISITPTQVLDDSRCPGKVNCVWIGEIRLRVLVVAAGKRQTVLISTLRGLLVAGGTLVLEAVLPARATTRAIPLGQYKFGFRFD